MICIHCGDDIKYKDRGDRRCPRCRHEFAFEPRQGDRLTDRAFNEAIIRVSADHAVRWGVEHLYYEIARRLRRDEWPWTWCVALCGFIGALVFLSSAPELLVAIPPVIAGWWLLRRYGRSRTIQLRREDFDEMWRRWQRVHGTPESVITRRRKPPKPRPKESDVADYSFDRAVICDRARTVDLLLANNFHFENNCAVLSIAGYPEGPFELVRAMLRRNPKLQVYAVHDCTPAGCTLAWQLSNDPGWFQAQGTVIEVGVRPSQARPFSGMYLEANTRSLVPGRGLSASEVDWLNRYSLELAAIRPEQVLKRLFRAINVRRADTARRSSGEVWYVGDHDSFASDADDEDGTTDSFG